MSQAFDTPEAAEDAFYDALDERDVDLMMRVWDSSDDIACLLPMQPFIHGAEVREMMRSLLTSDVALDIAVRHVRWVKTGDVAIHYVEEQNSAAASNAPAQGTPPPATPAPAPALLATNIYRRGDSGWTMILHQNAPPPPPGGPPMR
ncbi:MAG: nuclear transport factor 2 family protein [Thiohalocapsa sp.]|nr:nuclear transport factor 2 family protein [Thiohalocapsa sp.]